MAFTGKHVQRDSIVRNRMTLPQKTVGLSLAALLAATPLTPAFADDADVVIEVPDVAIEVAPSTVRTGAQIIQNALQNETDIEVLRGLVSDANALVDQAQAELDAVSGSVNEARANQEVASASLDAARANQDAAIFDKQAALDRAQEQLDAALADYASKAAALTSQITTAKTGLANAQSAYAEKQAELEAAKAKLAEAQKILDDINATQDGAAALEALNKAQATYDELQDAYQTADNAVSAAEEALWATQDTTQTAQSALDAAQAEQARANAAWDAAQAAYDAAYEEYEVACDAYNALDAADKAELEAAEAALAQAEADLAAAEAAWDAADTALNEANAGLEAAELAYDAASDEVNRAQANLDQQTTQRGYVASELIEAEKALDEAIAQSKNTEELAEQARQNLVAAKEEYDEAAAILNAAQKAVDEAGAAVVAQEAKIAELESGAAPEVSAYQQSAAGLFEFMASQATDAQEKAAWTQALAILVNPDDSSNAYYKTNGKPLAGYTNLGQAGDATALDNVKRSLAFIDECNTLRKGAPYTFTNGTQSDVAITEDLLVSPVLMAISMVQLNGVVGYVNDTSVFDHVRDYAVNENIAYGYADPFDGWYDEEKAQYDQGNIAEAGHFINILNNGVNVTGFALNTTARMYSGQVFTRNTSEFGMTTQAFAAALAAYEAYLQQPASSEELIAAKAELERLQGVLTQAEADLIQAAENEATKQAALTEADQVYVAAQQAADRDAATLESVQESVNNRSAALAELDEVVLPALQAELDEVQATLVAKQADLDALHAGIAQATNDKAAAQAAIDQAQADKAAAQATIDATSETIVNVINRRDQAEVALEQAEDAWITAGADNKNAMNAAGLAEFSYQQAVTAQEAAEHVLAEAQAQRDTAQEAAQGAEDALNELKAAHPDVVAAQESVAVATNDVQAAQIAVDAAAYDESDYDTSAQEALRDQYNVVVDVIGATEPEALTRIGIDPLPANMLQDGDWASWQEKFGAMVADIDAANATLAQTQQALVDAEAALDAAVAQVIAAESENAYVEALANYSVAVITRDNALEALNNALANQPSRPGPTWPGSSFVPGATTGETTAPNGSGSTEANDVSDFDTEEAEVIDGDEATDVSEEGLASEDAQGASVVQEAIADEANPLAAIPDEDVPLAQAEQSNTMMPWILTASVLAIILGVVIALLAGEKRRKEQE